MLRLAISTPTSRCRITDCSRQSARVNRRDGKDKDFGYIVHYKDLFKKVENAISVCTSELDRSAGGVDPEILLQDRLKKGKERLDSAIETLTLLCEPVQPPKANWNTFTILAKR